MTRNQLAAMLAGVLCLTCAAALAQQGGSTPQGDVLRGEGERLKGEGQFLRGAAWYELNSAKARDLDSKTAKTVYEWNREVYNDYKQDRADRLGYRKSVSKARQAQAKREMEEKEYRLRTSPTQDDVVRGDALNALLLDLFDPSISESQWRQAKVPLPEGLSIRALVFQFVPRMKLTTGQRTNAGLLAMGRLDAEGRWPIYLPENKLARERKEYEAAYHVIRDQCLKGKLSIESVDTLDKAIETLKVKAAKEVPTQRDYRQYAARFVEDMKSSARMFDAGSVSLAQEMIADMQGDRDAQTVGELLAFMRKYRLLFANSEQRPEDSDKYRQLYSLLKQQKTALGLPEPTKPSEAPAVAEATESPGASKASATPNDPFRVGSVWEGVRKYEKVKGPDSEGRDTLTITERKGEKFIGIVSHVGSPFSGFGPNKIEGTIVGGKVTLSETNPSMPRMLFRYEGRLEQNAFVYSVGGNGNRGVRRSGQGRLAPSGR